SRSMPFIRHLRFSHVGQSGPIKLSYCGARQRLNKMYCRRNFVSNEIFLTVCENLTFCHGGTRVEYQKSAYDFASVRMAHADHAAVPNEGQRKQQLLDLSRVHIETAHNHHFFLTPPDEQIPLVIQFAQISGI